MPPPELRLMLLAAMTALACADKDGGYDTVCFVGTTMVDTPSGPTRIDQLRAGDTIWSWNVGRSERVERSVVQVLPSQTRELTMVPTQEGWIAGVTATHPFAVADPRRWVSAAELQTGDQVVKVHDLVSAPVSVVGEAMVVGTTPLVVYDLSVQGPEHNFVADGWLVHNKQCCSSDSDQDGWYGDDFDPAASDCDDSDPAVNPGADEVCDDLCDNDCDDLIDASDPDCQSADEGARGATRDR